MLNVYTDGPGVLRICFGFARGSNQGEWTPDHISLIERLLPHIRHFVHVRQALVVAEAHGMSLHQLLDNLMIGAVLLDQRGSIMEANTPARDIFHQGDGLSDQDGYLRAHSSADQAQLAELLSHTLPNQNGEPSGGSMLVTRVHSLPLRLHASPVPVAGSEFGTRRAVALVLIVDSLLKPQINPAHVASTLGLTPAEGCVAASLAAGMSVHKIAIATYREESSVRWLVKNVFAKVGVSRQTDLVRMVLSITGGIKLHAANLDAPVHSVSEPTRTRPRRL